MPRRGSSALHGENHNKKITLDHPFMIISAQIEKYPNKM